MKHYKDENWEKILLPGGNKEINLSTGEERLMQPIGKTYECEVKDFSEKDKSFTAIASTEKIDRDGDILRADGWTLKNYRKNPSFLWGHDDHGLPIGKSLETWVAEKKLHFRPKFATEIYPFADMVWKMYKGKYLRSFSVRFDPIKSEDRELTDEEKAKYANYYRKPQDYKSQDLLEISAVNIGSNTDATKSPEMMDFVVKSYYARNPQAFPNVDFNKPIWNGFNSKGFDFTDDLKEKREKLEKLLRDKELKKAEQSIDDEIANLEKEIAAEKSIEELQNKLNIIQVGITGLVKK